MLNFFLGKSIMTILLVILISFVQPALAKGILISYGGETIIKVGTFPQTAFFQRADGTHIDPGYRYKQFSIFFVPLWNYDGQWCGYIGNTNRYIDLQKADIDLLATISEIHLPDSPTLPFWEVYGGKMLVLSIMGLFFLGRNSSAATA